MLSIVESMDELQQLPEGKVLINTVNGGLLCSTLITLLFIPMITLQK